MKYDLPDVIRVEADGPIRIVTLSRPDNLNAINEELHFGLTQLFPQLSADADARVAVITGEGRAFSAGGDFDLLDRMANDRALRRDVIAEGRDLVVNMIRCRVPVIAAVNGPAVGIGVTMTLAMDIRIAADVARFGFVFARRGIVPEACSSWFLPRIVGISRALEWAYSGRVFPADEALAGGLVRSLHPKEELISTARGIAREIADNTSAISVTLIRQMMWRMLGADHPMEAHKLDSRGVYYTGRSPDAREGVEAFLEKRSAKFPGKVSKDLPEFYPWWEERTFE